MAATLTVFVCSTFSDLSAEREAILDAIRRLQLQHDSMEFFGARAAQPIETCLREVRRSDVLVVVVGHRYGSIVPERGVSYSEAEYAEGYALHKPCLVYVRDENVPVLPKYMERDPEKLKLLEKWKSTLQQRHTVSTFQDGQKLALQVAADLSRTIQDLEEASKTRDAAKPTDTNQFRAEINKLIGDALGEGAAEASVLSAVRSALSALQAAKTPREPKVFLSYARADQEVVRRVAEGLQREGVQLFYDESSLKPGEDWMRAIERELASTDFLVFFISPNSVQSGWAKQELQVALHRQFSGEGGAVVLPILLEDADVPPLLRQFQWVDLRNKDIDGGIRRLIEAIRHWSRRRTELV